VRRDKQRIKGDLVESGDQRLGTRWWYIGSLNDHDWGPAYNQGHQQTTATKSPTVVQC